METFRNLLNDFNKSNMNNKLKKNSLILNSTFMKQKMKPIIKILILSFFITLFTRCSEDVYEENLSQSKRDYHFKKITFLELKSINNQAFIESSKLKKVLPPDKHNTLNSISNFDIDLQNIQYLKIE